MFGLQTRDKLFSLKATTRNLKQRFVDFGGPCGAAECNFAWENVNRSFHFKSFSPQIECFFSFAFQLAFIAV